MAPGSTANWELKPLMAFGDVTPDSEGLSSTNPRVDEVYQKTSQGGTNSGDEPLSSTSFCQTQTSTP